MRKIHANFSTSASRSLSKPVNESIFEPKSPANHDVPTCFSGHQNLSRHVPSISSESGKSRGNLCAMNIFFSLVLTTIMAMLLSLKNFKFLRLQHSCHLHLLPHRAQSSCSWRIVSGINLDLLFSQMKCVCTFYTFFCCLRHQLTWLILQPPPPLPLLVAVLVHFQPLAEVTGPGPVQKHSSTRSPWERPQSRYRTLALNTLSFDRYSGLSFLCRLLCGNF